MNRLRHRHLLAVWLPLVIALFALIRPPTYWGIVAAVFAVTGAVALAWTSATRRPLSLRAACGCLAAGALVGWPLVAEFWVRGTDPSELRHWTVGFVAFWTRYYPVALGLPLGVARYRRDWRTLVATVVLPTLAVLLADLRHVDSMWSPWYALVTSAVVEPAVGLLLGAPLFVLGRRLRSRGGSPPTTDEARRRERATVE